MEENIKIEEEFRNLHKDYRYKQIKLLFEKLFLKKDYSLGQKFNSKVWFLDKIIKENENKNREKNTFLSNESSYDISIENNTMLQKEIIFNSNKNQKEVKRISKINENIDNINKEIKEMNDFSILKTNLLIEIINMLPLSDDFLLKEENFKQNLLFFSITNKKYKSSTKSLLEDKFKFDIYVCDFIKGICDILLFSQIQINKHIEILNSINGISLQSELKNCLLKINNLEEHIKQNLEESKLNKKVYEELKREQEETYNGKSFIKFNIFKINNFPKGLFKFKLLLKELNSDYNVVSYFRNTLNNSIIEIKKSNECINFSSANINKGEYSFENVYLYSIQQEALLSHMKTNIIKEKIIMIKSQPEDKGNNIINPRPKNSNLFSRTDVKNISIDRRRKSTLPLMINTVNNITRNIPSAPHQNNSKLTTNKLIDLGVGSSSNSIVNLKSLHKNIGDDTQLLKIQEIPFHFQEKLATKSANNLKKNSKQDVNKRQSKIFDNVQSTSAVYLPINFNFQQNSGTNLIDFTLAVEYDNIDFGESTQSFIKFLTLIIGEIKDAEKNPLQIYLPLRLELNDLVKAKYNIKENCTVTLGAEINLKYNLKIAIIERIIEFIDYETMTIEHYKAVIDSLLVDYFPEISDRVKIILKDYKGMELSNCCNNSCRIY